MMMFVVTACTPYAVIDDEVKQMMVILGDVNAHIGSDREGLEECVARFGRDDRNVEGQNVLEMCSHNGWMIANT